MNNIILTLLFLFGTSFSFAQKSDSVRIAYDYVYFNPQKAIEMANRIIKTSENKDDQITARLIKTNAYSSLDDTYNALKYAFETYDYVKKEKDTFNEARILGRIGELFQLYGFNTQSRYYLEKSENLILSKEFSEEKRPMYLGNIYGIKGNGYKDDLDCDFALKYYDKSIKSYKSRELNQSTLNNLALVYIEKSNCLIDKSILDSATLYLDEAYFVIKKNNLIEYDQSAKTSLARIYQAKKDYIYSNQLLKEVLKEIKASEPISVNLYVYRILAQNAFYQQDYIAYKKYIDYIKKINLQLEKSNQEAKEKSLNFLLYKDQGFWYNLSFFKLPLVLLLVIIFLLFLKNSRNQNFLNLKSIFRNNKG